jgi:hypothetical protein
MGVSYSLRDTKPTKWFGHTSEERLEETASMNRTDKVLAILLRVIGVGALFALVAVFMPMSWMTATHRWLGLGEMPAAPIVEYLARSVSAFSVLLGAVCLVMAADLERYRPLVRFLGVAVILMSVVFTGVDLSACMPWWWTAFEGPLRIGVGAVLFFLARPNDREKTASTP